VKVLVLGGGGREHALAWKLGGSPSVTEVLCAPGNPGIAEVAQCIELETFDVTKIASLVGKVAPHLVVVGPEAPLVAGLADILDETPVFGPRAKGAQLEGSKWFAKRLMNDKHIPTSRAELFTNAQEAIEFCHRSNGQVAVKADGLAGGKGVTVCSSIEQAEDAVRGALEGGRFGEAGRTIVIEEKLFGEELSVLGFSDGKSVVAMPAAQDFKRAFDNDEGPNTGGMGSYSPVPYATEDVAQHITERVLQPAIDAMREDGEPYVGVLYAGLMLTEEGPKVIEFNCRFGDPETQALMPRLASDLGEVMLACVEGSLAGVDVTWDERACVCVVAASSGYPNQAIQTGQRIEGLDRASAITGLPVFHADTGLMGGSLVNKGGRVLSVSALGADLEAARDKAYEAIGHIHFDGMRFRTDIATRAIGAKGGV